MNKIIFISILSVIVLSILFLAGITGDVVEADVIEIKNPLKAKSFEGIVNNIIDFIFNIAIVLTPLMIIVGGVLFVTAGGNMEQVSRARNIIVWTLIGFAIVLLAKGISDLLETILGISG